MRDLYEVSKFKGEGLIIKPTRPITGSYSKAYVDLDVLANINRGRQQKIDYQYRPMSCLQNLLFRPSLEILCYDCVDETEEGEYSKMLKNAFISMVNKESVNFNNMLINNIKSMIKDNFIISHKSQVYNIDDAVYKFISSYDKKNIKKYTERNKSNIRFRNYKSFIIYNKNTFIQILTGDYAFKYSYSDQNKALMSNRNVSVENFIVINFIGKDAYKLMKKLNQFIEKEEYMSNYQYMVSVGNKRNSIIRNYLNSRDFNSLFFSENVNKTIKDHLNNFKNNMKLYDEKNLIYKTGILLYGEPGTGKSSLALAIASYLDCSIININMSQFDEINLNDLTSVINADKLTYVVLLEDIDTLINNRTAENVELSEQKIINKLLQFLDSGISPTNVVFIATTNHIDKLDNAILRDGRFDLKLEIKGITNKIDAEIMCKSFNLSRDQINNVLKDVKYPVNQSYLQGLILKELKK